MKARSYLSLVYLISLAAFAQSDMKTAASTAQQQPDVKTSSPADTKKKTDSRPPTADASSAAGNYTTPKGFVLEDATPVKMRINRTVSSADAHTGDIIDFEVLEDISVNGTLVIQKGGLAYATVTEAQAKRRIARGGQLDINIDYVRLVDSERAPLRAVKELKGGGHTGVMVGGMVATGVLFFPAAPFFLFMHGKDISIPKGTEVTAYVSGDVTLDLAKFQPSSLASINSGSLPQAPQWGGLQMESNPSGADIEVDGRFVGNTPSEVKVTEGDHTITVKKSGFKVWERKVKVSGGSSVHLSAELEKGTTAQ